MAARRKGLFAATDRLRPGWDDDPWAVWVSGTDDVLPQPDLPTALVVAAEHNAMHCDLYDGDPNTPVCHAVVLHHGYAWTRRAQPAAGGNPALDIQLLADNAALRERCQRLDAELVGLQAANEAHYRQAHDASEPGTAAPTEPVMPSPRPGPPTVATPAHALRMLSRRHNDDRGA